MKKMKRLCNLRNLFNELNNLRVKIYGQGLFLKGDVPVSHINELSPEGMFLFEERAIHEHAPVRFARLANEMH